MVLVLALFVIFIPLRLIARKKNENNPVYMTTVKKEWLIVYNTLYALVLGIFVFCFLDGIQMGIRNSWLILGAVFLCIYRPQFMHHVHRLLKI